MKKNFSYLSLFLTVLVAVGALILPISGTEVKAAAAKKKVVTYDLYNPNKIYKDEKKAIIDTASRCDTPAFKKTHTKNLERAKQDGKPFDFTLAMASTTEPLSPLGEAYQKYLVGLGWALEAMEEPYCGFGAFGIQAANKSYKKTVDRARGRFLEAVKQDKLSKKKAANIVAKSSPKK